MPAGSTRMENAASAGQVLIILLLAQAVCGQYSRILLSLPTVGTDANQVYDNGMGSPVWAALWGVRPLLVGNACQCWFGVTPGRVRCRHGTNGIFIFCASYSLCLFAVNVFCCSMAQAPATKFSACSSRMRLELIWQMDKRPGEQRFECI